MSVPFLHIFSILSSPLETKRTTLSVKPPENAIIQKEIKTTNETFYFFKSDEKISFRTRSMEKTYPLFYKERKDYILKTKDVTINYKPFDNIRLEELEIDAEYEDTVLSKNLIKQIYGGVQKFDGRKKHKMKIFVEIVPPAMFYNSKKYIEEFEGSSMYMISIKKIKDNFVIKLASNLFSQIIKEESINVAFKKND